MCTATFSMDPKYEMFSKSAQYFCRLTGENDQLICTFHELRGSNTQDFVTFSSLIGWNCGYLFFSEFFEATNKKIQIRKTKRQNSRMSDCTPTCPAGYKYRRETRCVS